MFLCFLCRYSYKSIVEFIDAQFEAYLQEELKIKRTLHSYHDTRIHACLYFIAPTGHSLKSLDLVTMKKLDSKVRFHFTFISSKKPFLKISQQIVWLFHVEAVESFILLEVLVLSFSSSSIPLSVTA